MLPPPIDTQAFFEPLTQQVVDLPMEFEDVSRPHNSQRRNKSGGASKARR